MTQVRSAIVSMAPLDLDEHLRAVDDDRCGAVTTFLGRVRDHDPDAATRVVALEYSAHPDAAAWLQRLLEDCTAGTDAVVSAGHRIGRLAVGELAVIVAVASSHRAEAFEVCRAVIEAIKRDLPVWKRQIESDGTTAWKGIGG